MLEQIHATAEDQRKTHTIVALGMVAFATYALGYTALHGLSSLTAAGAVLGTTGAVTLNWLRIAANYTPKRLAL